MQVYAVVVPRTAASTSVYYWFFYPYNLGKDVGLCLNQIGGDLTMSISGPDVAPASSSMASPKLDLLTLYLELRHEHAP